MHVVNKPYSGLFLDLGLGKTVIALTAITQLMYNYLTVNKVLIIGPKKVCESVWPEELEKWDHTKHLRYSLVLGTAKERREALAREADIYIINRENVIWMEKLKDLPDFDMLVIDELSSFKNGGSKRVKALTRMRSRFKRAVGLTATPAPKGFIDLWAQVGILDGGKRLGTKKTHYENKYFYPDLVVDHVTYSWAIKDGAEEEILGLISDMCISLKSEDHLDMPEINNIPVYVNMTKEQKRGYKEYKKEFFLAIGTDVLTASTAAVLSNKLLQYTSGMVYDEDKKPVYIHGHKVEALVEIVEQAGRESVLVYYNYRHERDRIMEALKDYTPRELKTDKDYKDWSAGKIKVLITHPASSGYGLNLQYGGHIIVWFTLPWDLQLYQQGVGRIYRQGQTKPVMNYRLMVRGTWDAKVWKSLTDKDTTQKRLINALKMEIE